MIIKKYEDKINIDIDIYNRYKLYNYIFFDIEVTGFGSSVNSIVLISCGRFSTPTSFITDQFFCENFNDERNTLLAFNQYISNFDHWCSFNGIAFDEPYLKKRLEVNNISFSLPNNHLDLFREIKPYKNELGLTSCSLKSIEKFLDLNRNDTIDGEQSVILYQKYLINNDDSIRDTLMLHNYEDVFNLPHLFNLLNKINIESLTRSDLITNKQKSYLKHLLLKNNFMVTIDYSKITKSDAAKIIDSLINKKFNSNLFEPFLISDKA